jgi:uncharacterized repeat protein (TIGR03809 family)
MINRIDVAGGIDIIMRWRALAEQRLEYLTDLFETGRWRRFYSEPAFLENIKEAKTAVETWRNLSRSEASDNAALDIPRLGRSGAAVPREEMLRDQFHRLQPDPVRTAAEPPALDLSIAAEADQLCSDEAPDVPSLEMPALDPDLNPSSDNASERRLNVSAMQQRYPLLRHTL